MENVKPRRVALKFKMLAFKGVDKGFALKREPSVRESRHILKNIMCINVQAREDSDDAQEYKEYNDELKKDVTNWLRGDCDDSHIMEYAYDCADDDIGIWTAFRVAEYLQKKGVI